MLSDRPVTCRRNMTVRLEPLRQRLAQQLFAEKSAFESQPSFAFKTWSGVTLCTPEYSLLAECPNERLGVLTTAQAQELCSGHCKDRWSAAVTRSD